MKAMRWFGCFKGRVEEVPVCAQVLLIKPYHYTEEFKEFLLWLEGELSERGYEARYLDKDWFQEVNGDERNVMLGIEDVTALLYFLEKDK